MAIAASELCTTGVDTNDYEDNLICDDITFTLVQGEIVGELCRDS